jgi:DamX protein
MVGNDAFTYHVKKPFIDQKSRVVHPLITEERIRKLELITHLISNSKKALVVCGLEGVGKSTMLKVLQERKIDSWLYCLVQGNAELSFETIQEQNLDVFNLIKQYPQGRVLSGAHNRLENQLRKIVLMIDQAGDLAPGLINTIIEYAAKHPVLRVIFVLTHDDLIIKNSSDNALDDCHLIEIPAFSEKQCGEFLQYLAAKPNSQVIINEISDDLISSLYRDTQGIPGRIIAELPVLEETRKSNNLLQSANSLRILVAAVAGLVILALGVQWFSGSKYNIRPTPNPAPDITKSVSIDSGEKK